MRGVAGDVATRSLPSRTGVIDWDLIRSLYDEMIRYATALRERTADAESLLRRLTRSNTQTISRTNGPLPAETMNYTFNIIRRDSPKRITRSVLEVTRALANPC